ncbi:SEC-C metal-binding domain-containing protein [Photobacterium leiognathi]|uniref:SEC-C metal-binding domain-containing protein n=1 Tax=Photobacterium leiognathi TaxID=553611 RepID=UPI0029824777|nr:SEC-C metal-binding domain-containing protein [Photobacterium leiognathi]
MLKPIKKEASVNESERFLSELAESTFFSLWSYPNIYRDEGCSKTNSGKEMCDLFVLIGNDAIVFSDKSIEFKGAPDCDVTWNRWYKKSIYASITQLHGCYSWLRNHPSRVFLDRECQDKFPFPLDEIDNIYLIAIVDDLSFRTEHVGNIGYDFTLENKKDSSTPFKIGLDDIKKPFTHVFNKAIFQELMTELQAVTDFIEYLKAKENAVRAGTIITAECEEQILAAFLNNRDRDCITGTLRDKGIPYDFKPSSWSEYKSKSSYYKHHLSQYVAMDSLLKYLSDAIVSSNVGLGKDQPLETHEIAVRMLAREPLLSRKLLAKAFEEKYLEVPKGVRSSRITPSIYFNDVTYIFVFYPQNNENFNEYRETRLKLSGAYALVAKRKMPDLKKIVVISTQTQGEKSLSEDIVYYNYERELSSDEKIEADKISRQGHILNKVQTSHGSLITQDNSPNRLARLKTRYGRNEPCHCGSGKKYKKCCL